MPKNSGLSNKKSGLSSKNRASEKEKIANLLLFSNNPKKAMKKAGYSKDYVEQQYEKYMKSIG